MGWERGAIAVQFYIETRNSLGSYNSKYRKAGASRSTILVFCVFRGREGGECVGYPLQLCEGLSGVQF